MNACKCGSHAINPHSNGRQEGVDLHLCDVCYWRTRAERLEAAVREHRQKVGGTEADFALESDRELWSVLDRRDVSA